MFMILWYMNYLSIDKIAGITKSLDLGLVKTLVLG